MVHRSLLLFASTKHARSFIDSLRVHVKGGGGGQGLMKYGGIGGRGGNVIVVGIDNAHLKKLRGQFPNQRFAAANGENSSWRMLQGKAGSDLEINVPPGIVIKKDDGAILGEVNSAGEKVVVAKGGRGGDPHNGFQGQKGDMHNITLDLKLVADIGLVGFPNAGKSTLLKALSRASPKIASYPFTTIRPQIGIIEYEDHRQVSVADLPGLIEGAHVNVGMGHNFLKHVERTKLLLFMVDIHGFRLSAQHQLRTPFENILLLNKELELYKQELIAKPAVLVLNKIDIEGADTILPSLLDKVTHMKDCLGEVEEEFRPQSLVHFDEVFTISAKNRLNTDHLAKRLRELLDVYADIEFERRMAKDSKSTGAVRMALTEHFGSNQV